MNSFKILTYEEEKKLSADEKKIYYIRLKEYLSSQKYSLTKENYLTICEMLNKKMVRTIIDKIKGYDLFIENQSVIPNGPVIYASSHQDFNDHFNVVLSIPTHTIILNSSNVPSIIKLVIGINGIEYVDRNDSQSRFESKIHLMEYLAKSKSVVVFPEATFNCSPNKLILPLHSGVIDIAKKMQVPIVPLIQEYDFDTSRLDGKNRVKSCTVRFGMPIYISYEDDIQAKKEELRDAMATIRYNLIEQKGIFDRKEISNEEYISFLLSRLHTMDLMKVNYEIEKNTIYGVNEEIYRYYPINAVPYNEKGELLTNGPVRKLTIVK